MIKQITPRESQLKYQWNKEYILGRLMKYIGQTNEDWDFPDLNKKFAVQEIENLVRGYKDDETIIETLMKAISFIQNICPETSIKARAAILHNVKSHNKLSEAVIDNIIELSAVVEGQDHHFNLRLLEIGLSATTDDNLNKVILSNNVLIKFDEFYEENPDLARDMLDLVIDHTYNDAANSDPSLKKHAEAFPEYKARNVRAGQLSVEDFSVALHQLSQ